MEDKINQVMLVVIACYLLLTIVTFCWFVIWKNLHSEVEDFFSGEQNRDWREFVHLLILYKELVPFSLYILLDSIKILQGKFIEWDINLYDEKRNIRSQVRSACEDLGKIEYVLTDKTGTLTASQMNLKAFVIGEDLYGILDPEDTEQTVHNLKSF